MTEDRALAEQDGRMTLTDRQRDELAGAIANSTRDSRTWNDQAAAIEPLITLWLIEAYRRGRGPCAPDPDLAARLHQVADHVGSGEQ